MNNYYVIVVICLEIKGFITRRGECFQTNCVPSLSVFRANASEALSPLVQNPLRICVSLNPEKTYYY